MLKIRQKKLPCLQRTCKKYILKKQFNMFKQQTSPILSNMTRAGTKLLYTFFQRNYFRIPIICHIKNKN